MTWTWSHWRKSTEREREKEKEIERDRVGKKKKKRNRRAKEKKQVRNLCEEEIEQHQYSNQQMRGEKKEEEGQRKGTCSTTHCDRK